MRASHFRRLPLSPRLAALLVAVLVSSVAAAPRTTRGNTPRSEAAAPEHTGIAAGDTIRVPLDLGMGQPVVDVWLNGRGPFRMFLDTGAGTTVIDLSLADELKLPRTGKTRIGDPSDPQALEADRVRIDSLRIGGATFAGVSGVTFDRSKIRPGPDMPRGVVGFPVFHDVLEAFDFPNATLRLTRGHLPPVDGRHVLAYTDTDGVPLISVDVGGAKIPAHLDTGSPGFVSIPEKDSSLVRFAGPLVEVGRGRTVNGPVSFRGATLDGNLTIGDVVFERPLVMLNDRLPDANVGTRALRDCVVTLEPAARRVSFERTRVSSPEPMHAIAGGTSAGAHVAGPPPGTKTAGVMLSPQPGGRLVVVDTLPGSVAAGADIRAGDEVLEIDGDAIGSLTDDERRARLHRSPLTLKLQRDGKTFVVTLDF